ncbi:hypothetical protein L6Q96_12065 [Candidatus Binatia bacterium]|nr:hypothetical protein [Candidatus Binatia bacterium]
MRISALLFVWTALAIALSPGGAAADPRTDYTLHCRGCHGPDGAGAPGGVPAFGGQLGKFLGVPGGREFLVRVPGSSQSSLDDARLAALLNWVLTNFSRAELPSGFVPYTGAEVGAIRHPPLTDVGNVRRRLIDAIAAAESSTSP